MDPDLELAPLESTSLHTRELRPEEIQFLKIYTGDNSLYKRQEGVEFLRHMSTLIGDAAIGLFRQTLQPTYYPSCTDFHRILWALCAMMTILRADYNMSIPRVLQRLTQDGVFQIGSGPSSNSKAKHCLISLIGWCSLLFIPSRTITDGTFDIDPQGAKCFTQSSIQLENAQRPVDELLRSFGELLPKRRTILEIDTINATKTDFNMKYHVSNLNVATLKQLADVKIVWVDAVSAHLDFNPTIPALCIFKAPSYCKLHTSNEAFLPLITRNFYTEGEHPIEDFSYQDLMREVILSYSLLFRDWRLSRKIYRQKERKRAAIKGVYGHEVVDPWLDRLCGMDLPTSWLSSSLSKQGVRETYDANSNFPILSKRLKVIQDYIEGIQPSRFSSLWRDRRDLRLWYTVWVVVIIGGISIVLAFISILLAGAQVAIALKSYDLQKQSSLIG